MILRVQKLSKLAKVPETYMKRNLNYSSFVTFQLFLTDSGCVLSCFGWESQEMPVKVMNSCINNAKTANIDGKTIGIWDPQYFPKANGLCLCKKWQSVKTGRF